MKSQKGSPKTEFFSYFVYSIVYYIWGVNSNKYSQPLRLGNGSVGKSH